ncbi:protein of unknown function (DUF3328) domain containing protein [Hyaloscypha variabilis]
MAISMSMFVSSRKLGRNTDLKRCSFFAPVLDRVDIPTGVKTIEGDLFTPENPSIARQYPNTETDAVWAELELTRTIVISAEDGGRLGKDPETVAKFEDDFWGFGNDAYMAQIDVFHQLHCLNSLRKLVYSDYYAFSNARIPHPQLWHNIMCTANTDLVTMNWMETQSNPFPDFNISHQCRDFEPLVEWMKENSKPEHVRQEAPKVYYKLFSTEEEKAMKLPL